MGTSVHLLFEQALKPISTQPKNIPDIIKSEEDYNGNG